MKKSAEFILVFFSGAVIYSFIEVMFRGYTHWTMFLTGGLVLTIIYMINIKFNDTLLALRCAVSCAVITLTELIVGCIVNLWLGMDVWDYSHLPHNFLGQICPLFSSLWFFLSFPANLLCVFIRRKMIGRPDSRREEYQLDDM